MPATAKKSTTKASSRANGAVTHPTWVDMIKECIVDNPGDARVGVSRPMIKKFVEHKYHIDLNPLTASQLNRAINSGSEKGIFLLPKGPSGKVKLAPKPRSDTAKENTKPPSKKPKAVSTKPNTTVKAPAKKTAGRVTTRAAHKPKALANTKETVKSAATTAKKSTSASKRFAATTKKATAHKKAKKSALTKKKIMPKRGAAKKAVIGKPMSKKSKSTTAAKAKPTPKTAA